MLSLTCINISCSATKRLYAQYIRVHAVVDYFYTKDSKTLF